MKSAFTLVEMLAAIAVVAILATLLFGSYQRTLKTARASSCVGKMRSLGSAVHAYIGENNGVLPYTSASPNWMMNISPYLDIQGKPQANVPFTKAFLCPDDPARAPRQLRTYRYHSSFRSGGSTSASALKKYTQIAKPNALAMLFCVAFIGDRELPIWTNDNAIWRESTETVYPPSEPGIFPRPHFDNEAVNILYYDGHAAKAAYPLPPVTFHFDGK